MKRKRLHPTLASCAAVAAHDAGIRPEQAEAFVSALFREIRNHVVVGDYVKVKGFGLFASKLAKAKCSVVKGSGYTHPEAVVTPSFLPSLDFSREVDMSTTPSAAIVKFYHRRREKRRSQSMYSPDLLGAAVAIPSTLPDAVAKMLRRVNKVRQRRRTKAGIGVVATTETENSDAVQYARRAVQRSPMLQDIAEIASRRR